MRRRNITFVNVIGQKPEIALVSCYERDWLRRE